MRKLTKEEKHKQCMKEIRATFLVVILCAAWHIISAFALNGKGTYLFGMPAWFSVSILGTAIIAVVGVVLLLKFVFVDFEYDDETMEGGN